MPTIDITLMGKGGVGKTTVTAIFAQHKLTRSEKIRAIDIDPVNASFAGFKALAVTPLNIMEDGKSNIDPRKFDDLMEILLSSEEDVVIDSGASTFLPLISYLAESGALSILKADGREVRIHVVLVGGQAKADSLTGFDAIARTLGDDAQIIVWLNEYFDPFAQDGMQFEDTGIYKKHQDRIAAIVTIPQRTRETFGKDISEMLRKKLTFDEAIASSSFNVMAKQRIKITKDYLFQQLDTLLT